MAYTCSFCGKSTKVGRSQQHGRGVAGRRWKKRAQETPRTFKPNIQTKSFKVGDNVLKMKVCTKCLKRIKNYKSIGDIKNIVAV